MRRKLVCVTWDFGLEFSRCYFTLFFGESAAECEYAVHLTEVKNYRYIGYSWFDKITPFLSFEGKKNRVKLIYFFIKQHIIAFHTQTQIISFRSIYVQYRTLHVQW